MSSQFLVLKFSHIFPKDKVASNKLEHTKRHHLDSIFQARFRGVVVATVVLNKSCTFEGFWKKNWRIRKWFLESTTLLLIPARHFAKFRKTLPKNGFLWSIFCEVTCASVKMCDGYAMHCLMFMPIAHNVSGLGFPAQVTGFSTNEKFAHSTTP